MEGRQEQLEGGGNVLGVARGPLSATVFFLMLTIAFSGIVEMPSTSTGVTETSSHWMGTCGSAKVSKERTKEVGRPNLGRLEDLLDRLADLGSDTCS